MLILMIFVLFVQFFFIYFSGMLSGLTSDQRVNNYKKNFLVVKFILNYKNYFRWFVSVIILDFCFSSLMCQSDSLQQRCLQSLVDKNVLEIPLKILGVLNLFLWAISCLVYFLIHNSVSFE